MIKSPMGLNRELKLNDTAKLLNLHRMVNDNTTRIKSENKLKISENFAREKSKKIAKEFIATTKRNLKNDELNADFSVMLAEKKAREI